MNIPQNSLKIEFEQYQDEYEKKAIEVLRSGWYITGGELEAFEREWADYTGAKYCVGLASGLDALWIAVKMLGIGKGDEVIVQANTYIATVMGVTINNATPIFVEPDSHYGIDVNKIEEAITERTKAILVVHLYGIPCDMTALCDICKRHNLKLIEDCAQSHGAMFDGKMTGTFGNIGCFSFYPTKNLGAFGDGGCIITDDVKIYEETKIYRNYGSEKRYYNKVVGANSRLDEIQAGLLRVKLSHLNEIKAYRTSIADRYSRGINNPEINLPMLRDKGDSAWHQYVILCKNRDKLQKYLKEKGIGTIIHYPIPPHLSEAYQYLGYKQGDFPIAEGFANELLSLPMYNGLSEKEVDYVIKVINDFRL